MEDGAYQRSQEGTPQGGSLSPLLCNIYLHYVLDLRIEKWRETQAKGDVIIVRYADDFVLGFQSEAEARRCLAELRERIAALNLELHPEKTRLIEFGRFEERFGLRADQAGLLHSEGVPERGEVHDKDVRPLDFAVQITVPHSLEAFLDDGDLRIGR